MEDHKDSQVKIGLQDIYGQYFDQQAVQKLLPPMPPLPTFRLHQPPRQEYVSKAKQRVSIPISVQASRSGASLEMTLGQEQGDGEFVEFTIIIPGRQSVPFQAHRKDLEALTNELSLAKLAQ